MCSVKTTKSLTLFPGSPGPIPFAVDFSANAVAQKDDAVIDRLTRWPEAICLTNITAQSCAEALSRE